MKKSLSKLKKNRDSMAVLFCSVSLPHREECRTVTLIWSVNALNLTNPRNCNLRNADKIPREISKLPTAAEGGNSRQIFFLSHKFHRRAKKKLLGNSSGHPLSSCQGSRCVRFEIKPYELPSQIAGTRLSLLYQFPK